MRPAAATKAKEAVAMIEVSARSEVVADTRGGRGDDVTTMGRFGVAATRVEGAAVVGGSGRRSARLLTVTVRIIDASDR
ncbi:hypothetical protein GUJ93_ZPchr0001g30410 [Zizania palustris]|uniref:Uncharacterized protein n=1 Tax=Zizania palustris TaxID=103762 RepID=A0A8J5S7U5_ZIZPA|nr:hypothetical protein GUJ93_ZPchr0001g30410 [Zizania palustris]